MGEITPSIKVDFVALKRKVAHVKKHVKKESAICKP